MKNILYALLCTFLLTNSLIEVKAADLKKLDALANGDHRSAKNKARNDSRHPVKTLAFFGIQEDMTVVELAPGGGWYTEIIAPYLKDKGQYIAAGYDPESEVKYFAKSAKKFEEKLKAQPDHYGKTKLSIMAPPKKMDYAPAGSADMVLTFRSTHGWYRRDNAEAVFASIVKVLKPGGVLGLVQHRANPGADFQKGNLGYLPQKEVIQLAEKAGLKLVATSEINANSKDTKDHPKGVWTLPPSFRLGDTDRAKYAAIGESDRMTLKFMKPKK